jgi:hypothetical protein
MAGTTGLEPATSAVTGQRSNQLNYVPRVKPVALKTLKPCDEAIRQGELPEHFAQAICKIDPMVGGHGFEPRTFPV